MLSIEETTEIKKKTGRFGDHFGTLDGLTKDVGDPQFQTWKKNILDSTWCRKKGPSQHYHHMPNTCSTEVVFGICEWSDVM